MKIWYISASDKYSGKAVIGQSVVGTHEPEGVHLLIRLREAAFIHISILLIYIVDMYTFLLCISIFTLCRYLPYPKLDCAAVVAAEPSHLIQKLLARLAREKYFMK